MIELGNKWHPMLRHTRRVHFIGIGGAGMCGIAEVLLNLGYQVSGSELQPKEVLSRLRGLGANVTVGHNLRNVENVDVVVYSSAVFPDNAEIVEARKRKIPVIRRAEMLAELMRMKFSVAVAGTHGKTTTTSLMASIMAAGKLDPTVVVGGLLNAIGANARLGSGDYLVAEADESDGTFLGLLPSIAVVTNIDPEHLDFYGDFKSLKRAFLEFINKVPFYGFSVLCLDHPVIQELIPHVEKRFFTYGFTSQADYSGKNYRYTDGKATYSVLHYGEELGEIQLNMPGRHNAENALAAVAVACELNIHFEIAQEALGIFEGIGRRLERVGERSEVLVMDDYGHHPEEIRVTLRAVREAWPGRRLVVAFQPHRFSRTEHLMNSFYTAFSDADVLFVLPIYAAGESPVEGITSGCIAKGILEYSQNSCVELVSNSESVKKLLLEVRPGDLVLTLGAGDVWKVGQDLFDRLQKNFGQTGDVG